jgi:hypothetical protein
VIGLSGRDDEQATPDHGRPDHALPTLPATVIAAHFTASAAELAAGECPHIADLADLVTVVEQLVTGQRYVAAALTKLSDHVAERHADGAFAVAQGRDVTALADVLAAAAAASGHAAGALSQSRAVLDIVLGVAGPDTLI